MNGGQPPWHACRLQLARSLQSLQSANNEAGRPKENDAPQHHDNAVQLLHSRIAAVKRALLAGPSQSLPHCEDASHNAEGSAATRHVPDTDLDDAAAGEHGGRHTAAEVQRIFSDAVAAHDALDFAAALPLFKLAGSAGHGPSCGYAALYCIEGRATERDKEQAWVWACKGEQLHDADSIGLKAR
jgi:hypothetical protein